MIKKVIFYISIISFVLLTFLIFEMLPFIYESSWQGLLFLILVIITFICEIFILINKKSIVEDSYLNSIFIVIATTYVSFMYYNIYSSNGSLYDISMVYFKNNYFILAMIFLFIILNMIINYIYEKNN